DPNTAGTGADVQAQTRLALAIRAEQDSVARMINRLEWVRKQLLDLAGQLRTDSATASAAGAKRLATLADCLEHRAAHLDGAPCRRARGRERRGANRGSLGHWSRRRRRRARPARLPVEPNRPRAGPRATGRWQHLDQARRRPAGEGQRDRPAHHRARRIRSAVAPRTGGARECRSDERRRHDAPHDALYGAGRRTWTRTQRRDTAALAPPAPRHRTHSSGGVAASAEPGRRDGPAAGPRAVCG